MTKPWIPLAANERGFYRPEPSRLERLDKEVLPFLEAEAMKAASGTTAASLAQTLSVVLGIPCGDTTSLVAACKRFIEAHSGSLWRSNATRGSGGVASPHTNRQDQDEGSSKTTADGSITPTMIFADVLRLLLHSALSFELCFHPATPSTPASVEPTSSDDHVTRAHVTLRQNAEFVCWTKAQCFCILSCAFLCLFPRPSCNCCTEDGRWGEMPSINYDEMFFVNGVSLETEKLLMFLDYVWAMTKRDFDGALNSVQKASPSNAEDASSLLSRPFIMLRHGIQDLDAVLASHVSCVLMPFTVHPLGASIDEASSMLRVDFANRLIGGASLSYGCVQEEISFSICPELNTARLIHAPMKENEAIVLCGAEQFSRLEPGTYGFRMRHGGPVPAPCPRGGAVLAVDAMDYRFTHPSGQYEWVTMRRELTKLLAAFLAPVVEKGGVEPGEAASVATGNWGCGVFGGDVELKFLLQWIACSIAKKHMHYFPFDDSHIAAVMDPLGKRMMDDGLTVGHVIRFLKDVVVTQPAAFVRRRGSCASQSIWDALGDFVRTCVSE
jgi:poly(ADP-ribose) glycohydrolase